MEKRIYTDTKLKNIEKCDNNKASKIVKFIIYTFQIVYYL
jgi:hypothetical protein